MNGELSGYFEERQFLGVLVKRVCKGIYGSPIHSHVWKNWREWAGVGKRSSSYSFDQFCCLIAIASIRAKEENRYRELGRREIRAIADSLETHELLRGSITAFDQEIVLGKDAPIALKLRGVKVSKRSLYRNVPLFSATKIYAISYLEQLATA